MGNDEYLKIIDKQSSVYDKERLGNYFGKTIKTFKKLIPKGSSAIEIGSGTGLYVIHLNECGRPTVGIDYSKKMVDIAKRNAKKEGINCKFLLADAEKELSIDQKFDFVLLKYSQFPINKTKSNF
jgi:ubiquinone/menaquinone biosynthesis C-methylase UbiE